MMLKKYQKNMMWAYLGIWGWWNRCEHKFKKKTDKEYGIYV